MTAITIERYSAPSAADALRVAGQQPRPTPKPKPVKTYLDTFRRHDDGSAVCASDHGTFHAVGWDGRRYDCDCPAFQARARCRHADKFTDETTAREKMADLYPDKVIGESTVAGGKCDGCGHYPVFVPVWGLWSESQQVGAYQSFRVCGCGVRRVAL